MKIKELIRRLRQEDEELEIKMFAVDHDPKKSDEGIGTIYSIFEECDKNGTIFIALMA